MARSRTPAPPRPARFQDVADPAQIALLASPVRQDIVDTLVSLGGEADVAAVAAELGRAADGLYYHFEKLADAGLLQRLDAAAGARRYRIGAHRGTALRLVYGEPTQSGDAVRQVVAKVLQAAGRDFRAALTRPGVRSEGPARELWAGRTRGWLDADGLEEANALLARLHDLLRGPRQPGQDQLFSLSFVLAPLPGHGPRRTRGKAAPGSDRPPEPGTPAPRPGRRKSTPTQR